MQGRFKEEGASSACAGLEPMALLTSASDALDAFTRRHAPSQAEVFLAAERRLSLEYEAGTGTSVLNQGASMDATARVAWSTRQGLLSAPVDDAAGLSLLLDRAEQLASPGRAAVLPDLPAPASALPAGPAGLLPEAAARRMAHFIRTSVPRDSVVQAAVLSQSSTWRAVVRAGGMRSARAEWREELFVRCETPRGAVVDAVSFPPGAEDEAALVALRLRLAEAVEALTGPAEAVDRSLPLVLRPAVAAPLAAGLVWLLRGDIAAATPALGRAVGRKLFPSALSVVDDPSHPAGTRRVDLDDEGVPTAAVSLVEEGRLRGFLHSADTASRLGAPLNARGFRSSQGAPTPEAVNPFVVPGASLALPAHHTELVARVETFTTMPRPGTVTLVAGGWEVRDGRRVRRVAPVELELPVLETFRALRGVGADLAFFPTAEGCGTPTLVFPPLLAGGGGGQASR
ncbi:metallopeptidase TldD-related protein [Myxococcus sp. Y35]|uniref:metallopeptidase TldD-related protein n=1 Tax=Pseudomyxococcus flavus TaxID=3115648 RepID=UPI003CF3D893